MTRPMSFPLGTIVVALLLAGMGGPVGARPAILVPAPGPAGHSGTPSPVTNFTAAINRMVELVGFAGSGILALVWARVALSWFSNDVTKKIQAKDRARDALVGSLLFTAAVTGLAWGLAHWVVTGT
ncbi:MAG TPA: hypothetical protein VML94_05330 [Thermoplasmata archaeon]|nr:hypothetical protein [Thermoplasmata archaeon]